MPQASAPWLNAPRFQRFPRLVSRNLDEVRAAVGQVFCEHHLNLVGRNAGLDTRVHYRHGQLIGHGRMRYGATVDIHPGELNDFYLLQLPLQGGETIVLGNQEAVSTPNTASLVSPGVPFHMRHDANAEKLFLRISQPLLEEQYCRFSGQALRGKLVFAPTLELDREPGLSLRHLVGWHCREASDGVMFDHAMLAGQAAETLVLALLQHWPHNQSLQGATTPLLAPHHVRRAEAYLEANAHLPLTAADIAQHAGVSTRTLFASFRKYRNTSPLQHLRQLRLQHVHHELQNPEPDTQVTTVALRWGFGHLGQFSALYRQHFHELPSATLARSRG